MKKKDKNEVSKVLMMASLVAIVMSTLGYFGIDIWLVSTQWLLVAAVLALFGVYLKIS